MRFYRLVFLVVVLAILLQVPLVSYGQDNTRPIDAMQAMGELLPPVDAFAVVANDPYYLDWLDALVLRITSQVPDEVLPTTTLRAPINQTIVPGSEADFVSLLTALVGDYVAVGVDRVDLALTEVPLDGSPLVIYVAAPIRNRLLVDGVLTLSGILNEAERSIVGRYSTYTLPERNMVLAVGSEHLFVVMGSTTLPLDLDDTLADVPDFRTALEALPLDDYGAVFYGASGGLMRGRVTDLMIHDILAAFDLDIAILGPMAGGVTIMNGNAVLLDMAQVRLPVQVIQSRPVHADFARYIPGEAQVFIHTMDIEVLLNTTAGLIASISASDTTPDVYHQIERLVALLLGMDLEADILPWIDGGYGAFATFDPDLPSVQIGVLLEISDPAGADQFVTAIANAVGQFSAGTVIEETTLATESGTLDVITFQPLGVIGSPLDIVLGHNESFLFVATHDAAVNLLDGGLSLADVGRYQTAQGYVLPANDLTLYVDGDAPLTTMALLESMQPALLAQLDPTAATISPRVIAEMVESGTISAMAAPNSNLVIRTAVVLDME